MSVSTSNVTVVNIPLSPMRVSFNAVDLGGTTSECSLSIKAKMGFIKVDQFGDSNLDAVVVGFDYEVKVVLAEVKNKSNWKVVFPSMHKIVNGGVSSIYADMQIGDHMSSHWAQLLLHPLENANTDYSEDYLFYRAASIQATEVKYGPSKQTGLSVTFMIFPDTTTSPARYMLHGDPANGQISASAGAPAAGSNTGNGTCTLATVFNGVTETETITLTCLGSSTAGSEFGVAGSLSGALGTINVAAASTSIGNFVPNAADLEVITFRLTQGTVQWVLNDSFTIATVASNYY